MKFYIKQHIFTFSDKFSIYDSEGNECFNVYGEVFTLGKKLHLSDTNGNELAFIEQKVFSFLPKYRIIIKDEVIAEIVKEFTFFRNEYTVNGLGWKVSGDFIDHDYIVSGEDRDIAVISKQWFTWGDTYEIDISDGIDVSIVLAVVLVIDACLASQND